MFNLRFFFELITWLNSPASAEESKWVDVEEALPEESGTPGQSASGAVASGVKASGASKTREKAISQVPEPRKEIQRLSQNESRWVSLPAQKRERIKLSQQRFEKMPAQRKLQLRRKLALWRALTDEERDRIRVQIRKSRS